MDAWVLCISCCQSQPSTSSSVRESRIGDSARVKDFERPERYVLGSNRSTGGAVLMRERKFHGQQGPRLISHEPYSMTATIAEQFASTAPCTRRCRECEIREQGRASKYAQQQRRVLRQITRRLTGLTLSADLIARAHIIEMFGWCRKQDRSQAGTEILFGSPAILAAIPRHFHVAMSPQLHLMLTSCFRAGGYENALLTF